MWHACQLMCIIAVPIRSTIHGNYKTRQLISAVQFMCQSPLLHRVCKYVLEFYKIRGFVSLMLSLSYRGQNCGVLQNTCTKWQTLLCQIHSLMWRAFFFGGGDLCLSDHSDTLSISWSFMQNWPPPLSKIAQIFQYTTLHLWHFASKMFRNVMNYLQVIIVSTVYKTRLGSSLKMIHNGSKHDKA